MFRKNPSLEFFESLYQKFNRINSAQDPIWNLIHQQDKGEQELLAFISAQYAFGSITQINNFLKKIFELLLPSPVEKILDKKFITYLESHQNLYHRFLFHPEFIGLIKTLRFIIQNHENLKKFFLMGYNSEDENLKYSIISFSRRIREIHARFSDTSNRKLKFLYPSPESNSTCKRINLFLRWMVRKDNVDLGLWRDEIKTSQLIIPLDTHIFQLSKHLKLTTRKSPSWNMAVEITNNLKKFDPDDPVKYDFALSHIQVSDIKEMLKEIH